MTPTDYIAHRRSHDAEMARQIIASTGRRTRVGPVSIKTDETGKVRIEPAKRKKSVSQHIKDRKSPKRKFQKAQRP